MKKLISVFLCLALVLSVISLFSISGFALESGDYTYELNGDEVTITAYTGSDDNISIPAEIDGHPVVRIAVQAFRYNKTIKSIYIHDSVTTIDAYAFRDCTALESVRLPETLTVLKAYTFYGCTKLNNVVIPASVTNIEQYALGNCKSLKTVTIMGETTTINNNAFYLTNLETAYIHENSPADDYTKWPSGMEKIYLEDVDPVVSRVGAQVKMKPNSATTVEDDFQIRIISKITDEDWDFNFGNTRDKDDSATSNVIKQAGIVAYRGTTSDFNADTAKAVVNGSASNSDYSFATTSYFCKDGDDADAQFGAIIKAKHSTLPNDIVYMGFIKYLDVNGTERIVFYETSYTAAVVSNYDTIVSNYLAAFPYSA